MKRIKLTLSRQIIRTLTPSGLTRAIGGIPPNHTDRCTDRCTANCSARCSDGCGPPPETDGCITDPCFTRGTECVFP